MYDVAVLLAVWGVHQGGQDDETSTFAPDDYRDIIKCVVKAGAVPLLSLLIQAGVDVNFNVGYDDYWDDDDGGHTLAHVAAASGQDKTLILLMDAGADANATDYRQSTPLHVAAANGHEAVVVALLQRGANIEAVTDMVQSTPLHVAAANGHEAVVEVLLQRGANIEAVDCRQSTPLHVAADNGH